MDPTIGKIMATLGTVAFVVQMGRLTVRWWANRRRRRMLDARRTTPSLK